MKRLIILCVGLLAFSVSAAQKVIEQQGGWTILEQDNWSKPTYILLMKNEQVQFKLVCMTDTQRIVFGARYFDVKRLNGTSLSTNLSIKLDNKAMQYDFWGSMFNYNKNTIFWTNNLDYIHTEQEKIKLIPIFSQLFKQLPSVTGNITFTANGEENTLYQVSVSTEGLPVMFTHFVKYCGTDFMAAFDISIENQ